MIRKHIPALVLCLLCASLLSAQVRDSLSGETPDEVRQILEDYLQNIGDESSFDFNTIIENLDLYRRKPLNLNKARETDLRELLLLSDMQVLDLLTYRVSVGELISIYELQAIPSFNLNTIRAILPYVSVSGDLDDYNVPIRDMLRGGRNELFLRWTRILEQQRGYTPLEPGQTSSRYAGDPNQLYTRFRHSFDNRMSFGFTAEKDRGEEFFKGSNKKGFDFYSAHFFLYRYNRTLQALAIGDYAVMMGQGLISLAGFNGGKSALVGNIKRGGRTLRPFTSVNEAIFMRGAAATIGIGDRIEATAFVSLRGRDGNILQPDTIDQEQGFLALSSLNISGFHRTPSEIANRNSTQQFTTGGSVKYKHDRWHLALNAIYDRFDTPLAARQQSYARFYFSGNQLLNASVDYSYVLRNFNFFGETAMSDNGAVASLNGLLIGLDRRVDFAVLHRHYPRHFQTLNGNGFGETTGNRNETGLYLGLEMRPAKQWIVSAYFDTWRHPWLRFGVDAPSRGYEYRARITYFQKRKLQTYFEIRDEIKEANFRDNETPLNFLTVNRTFQGRWHFAYNVSKRLEWRTRLDAGFADNGPGQFFQGFVLYQDFIYRPLSFPVSFSTRLAFFDTDGYESRFYAYENDLLYTFSIPAYYNKGTRFYLNARYRGIRNLTIEARYAQTYWANQKTFGSGLEQIDGPTRSQVSAQIKYQF